MFLRPGDSVALALEKGEVDDGWEGGLIAARIGGIELSTTPGYNRGGV